MVLLTALEEGSLCIGIFADVNEVSLLSTERFFIPSESYLRQIETVVQDAGGWSLMTVWYVAAHEGSFTALRGLVTIVNILAAVHGLPVVMQDRPEGPFTEVALPMHPAYHAEPNISVQS